MTQFTKLYTQLFEQGYNANEVVAFSLLHDRMNSSIKRSDFFDKKESDFFVIYTLVELAENINISERTASKIMNKLINDGLITVKRQFNKASKIFIPNFQADKSVIESSKNNVQEKSAAPYTQNVQVNQTNLNQTKNTNDTDDTKNLNYQKAELENLAESLIQKGGLSEQLVTTLSAYSNDRAALYNYASLIYKAKNKVAQQATKVSNGYAATRFETNDLLSDTLANKIQSIIISAEHKAKNKSAYIMSSLINIFEEKANEFMMEI
ncbi:winged helix-turn-helix transcriptional regulator [Lactobacillus sp. S2-2]|uniref:winged helix-turn-helix transcriptional regulator n=1 Tax=Lactobacillus sp. S2-2 TaxID=2692917 RepID=UPI001F179BE7|nr:winged helix-turn-helix transcriptional regulator [Lactobacillus sp. S2-2]MCF6515535.1 winged helix-turn-helix transcriptional regulator [Lactobacillus sp. S2-2]